LSPQIMLQKSSIFLAQNLSQKIGNKIIYFLLIKVIEKRFITSLSS
jgi:hypothetical protein